MSADRVPGDEASGGVERAYVLGRTQNERARLDIQGAFYAEVTRRALAEGGVEAGMRVLDLGSGTGAVTLLAAGLVGPRGSVTGIDGDEHAVLAARSRAQALGVGNVAFIRHEIRDDEDGAGGPDLQGPFDALVGRFVLMHQDDPSATLARAARLVRPGGRIVFLESAMGLLLDARNAEPPCALYDRIVRWQCAAVGAAGADIWAGLRLRRIFLAAGLPAPSTRLDARVEGDPDSPLYRYYAESVRSILPQAEALGVEGFTAGDLDTLEEELRTATVEGGHALVAWPVVSAWCAVPAA